MLLFCWLGCWLGWIVGCDMMWLRLLHLLTLFVFLVALFVFESYNAISTLQSSSASSEEEKSESDSEWESSSSSSSDSESDAEGGAYSQLKGRARWLKKNTVVKEKVVKDKEGRGKARAEAKAAAALAKAELAAKEEETKENEEEMSAAVLNRKCKEVVMSRGRRGTDSREILKQLENLSRLALKFGPRIEIPILMHTITAQFDLVRTLDDYMETPIWKSCIQHLERVASVLEDGDEKSSKYTLGPANTEDDDVMIGNVLGKKTNKMKDVGDLGAVNVAASTVELFNPHTVS